LRTATVIIGLLDALACAVVAVATYNSGSDPATIGFDYAAGVIVAGLFVVTGLFVERSVSSMAKHDQRSRIPLSRRSRWSFVRASVPTHH
jgi:hypothetical protein